MRGVNVALSSHISSLAVKLCGTAQQRMWSAMMLTKWKTAVCKLEDAV